MPNAVVAFLKTKESYSWWLPVLASLLIGGCSDSPEQPADAGTSDVAADVLPAVDNLLGEMPPADLASDSGIELTWTSCDTTDWPLGIPKPAFNVTCTFIDVPLDHQNPAGGTITLRLARRLAKQNPAGKAFFSLAGGPGGSAVNQSGFMHALFSKVAEQFDMVFVDQRGTGGSGYLGCTPEDPFETHEWESCAKDHNQKPLNHYLSLDYAHDLDFVRRALGYQKIYLYGISYGTRVGLEYMRQYEGSIAAIVLDGLVPPETDLFGGLHLHQGVLRLINDCKGDPQCLAVSPDLEADLTARREQLKNDPRPIVINGAATVEDEDTFVYLLTGAIYMVDYRFRIPRAIHQAVQGNSSLWNQIMGELIGGKVVDAAQSSQHYLSSGARITINCAEFFPNSEGLASLHDLYQQFPWAYPHSLPLAAACEAWNVEPIAEALRQPVVSSVKALLLSGDLDLNTPAEWGTAAAKSLSNGTHLIIPYTAHETAKVPCVNGIIEDFILAEGAMAGVDTSCIQQIEPPAW